MADDACERCGVPEYEEELVDFVTEHSDWLVLCRSCIDAKSRELDEERSLLDLPPSV